MIYENNVLKQILIDGGYIAFSGPAHYYYYYLKDHLGNNRVVVSPSGTPLQVNHYYPFGGLFGESTGNSLQRFRFNGKEFDRTHGLDWYDYGARHMSPDVGRFTTIDPMAEKYFSISPYAYCANNPVRNIDMNGEEPGDFFKKMDDAAIDFGRYINKKSIKENKEYMTSFYVIKNEKGETGYTYFEPIAGKKDQSGLKTTEKNGEHFINGEKVQATGHTHGAYDINYKMGNDVFSGITKDKKVIKGHDERKKVTDITKDIGSSNVLGLPDYLVTPNGSLQQYNPSDGSVRLVSKDMPKDENDPNKIDDAINMYK